LPANNSLERPSDHRGRAVLAMKCVLGGAQPGRRAAAQLTSRENRMSARAIEFMRYSAPDPEALARDIESAREELAEAIQNQDTVATVDRAADLGSMLTTARREEDAVRLLQAHASLAEVHAQKEVSAWYWNALGTALQYTGRRSEAERYFAKAAELSRTGGWLRILAMTLHHWGRSLAEQRRFDEAENRLSEALKIRIQIGEPRQDRSRKALAALGELRRNEKSPVGNGERAV